MKDEKYFTHIYKTYRQRMWYFATELLKNDHDAKDIVQQVFIKLWERFDKFSEEISIKVWLYRTIKHSCFDLLQSKKRLKQRKIVFAKHNGNIQEYTQFLFYKTEVLNELVKEINLLSPSKKDIFVLSLADLSSKEIANKMNKSFKTVVNERSIALNTIKRKFDIGDFRFSKRATKSSGINVIDESTGDKYQTLQEAYNFTGISPQYILLCCKQKSEFKGHKFRFL